MNFRKVMSGIDPAPLLRQIEAHPELWNNDPSLRVDKAQTALHAVDNITLRRIAPPAPGRPPFRNLEAFGVLDAAQKIVFDLMRAVPGDILSQVLISRMAPGEVIEPHADTLPPGFPLTFHRYQVPLSVFPGVRFVCGGEELYMRPGSAYWFDNQAEHSVVNNSSEDRLSMRVDLRPFSL